MKKLLALAALATVSLTGVSGGAQAGYYGHSYGYSYVEEVPVYRVYRPRYVKRFYVKRHYVPTYSYHGGY